ncbi:Flp pilus assembly protein TadB [Nocardioides scoriae]|uniref:Flp pilus assembly protein TadB n=1 Tax=Nocardioides scoriae TaxID=642780 RepID=A0A1H1UCZ8_9ACTN|nr:type II secretion system F family protein [Nocardioides scoriae]SDS70347.1 Flp pilus assembly protein TadB [Nocardioides scoriae]
MSPVLAVATLAALAAALAWPTGARPWPRPSGAGPAVASGRESSERALLARLRLPLGALAGAGAWAFLGGPLGVVGGVVAGLVAWVVLGRAEDPGAVRRRERLTEELPTAVDLLGCCLDAGAAPEQALGTVGRALGGPVAEELDAVHARLELGVDPRAVWHDLGRHPQLAPLGRTVARAHDSGASVAEAVHQLAAELRLRTEAEVEARARRIEVRAAAPLGACLLPAFVLLGIVPMVAGVFGAMRVFG